MLTQGAENQTKLIGETAHFSCEFLTDMQHYVYWMFLSKDDDLYSENVGSMQDIVNESRIIVVRVVDNSWNMAQ